MSLNHVYGVDMGTGTVKIYEQNNDTITKEVNMIAVRNEDTVIAVGNDAYAMYEKTPDNIRIISPMRNGRINDVLMMEAILHTLLGRTGGFAGFHPLLFFSVPVDMTEIEKRAYSTIARKGRFRKSQVFLLEKPIADALALGIPLHHTRGSMIINIGAQSTEVSFIAKEHVIISRMIPIGGQAFTSSIVNNVRRKNSFVISQHTAQRLKLTLTDLGQEKNEGCKVSGIDLDSGLPRNGIVTSYNITSSVASEMQKIAAEIHRIMERIPPQIHANVMKEGIYVTGGSTHIAGIVPFLENALGCPVNLSRYYELSTVCGLKELINHPELQHWAYLPGKKSST
ncbi:MAG: rod shape-determining protein [Eubacterium sp.]|nr:rod shape-determining protein [Eubacterium sp.]